MVKLVFMAGSVVALVATALATIGFPERPCLIAAVAGTVSVFFTAPYYAHGEIKKTLDEC